MIIISYDISNTKLRSKFNKFIKQYGYMLQYSVYEITHSKDFLNKISLQIELEFAPLFEQCDSVMIFQLSKTCKKTVYGYAKNVEADIIVI